MTVGNELSELRREPLVADTGSGPTLAGIRQWMLGNLAHPMTLDELARRAHRSRRQFTREFRSETGTSPGRWLLRQRLQRATRLLEAGDLPVERIAASAGFPSSAALRRQFKRHTGRTPSAHRARSTSPAGAGPRAFPSNLQITPAVPSDTRPLLAFFRRNSVESRRDRFHGSLRRFPPGYLRAVTCGDGGVIARVARDHDVDPGGGCLAAFGTASPLADTQEVEVAVWVDDRYRRRGLATRLLSALLEQAACDGYAAFVAYLEPNNAAAVALARGLAHRLGLAAPTGAEFRGQLPALPPSTTSPRSTHV